MKKLMAIMLTSLLAITLTSSMSLAVDKLVVQDGSANDVFTVDDAGTMSAVKVGVGTATPTSTLSVVSDGPSGPTRGMAILHYQDGAAAPLGQFYKANGSEASPTSVATGDYTGSFAFRNYTDSGFLGNAFFGAAVNGTVTPTSAPTDIFFCNSDTNVSNCFGENKVNLLIKSTGDVNLPQLSGSYSGGSAYLCINNSGDIYASEAACP